MPAKKPTMKDAIIADYKAAFLAANGYEVEIKQNGSWLYILNRPVRISSLPKRVELLRSRVAADP